MKAIQIRKLARCFVLASAVLFICVATPASATWQIYASGDFGYSIAKSKANGSVVVTADPDKFSGSDKDVSPVIGGAIGLEVPMFELTPWRLPYDWRLPEWPVRFEAEVSGLREYRPETDGLIILGSLTDPFHTKVKAWTYMNNLWFDIPLRGLHRPIQKANEFLFRDPRMPRLKRFLEPLSMYAGVGIGFSHLKLESETPEYDGKKKQIKFAYQVGAGFGYQVTENLNLGIGYRYIQPSKLKMRLRGTADSKSGKFKFSTDVHEIRFVARFRILDLPYPWR